MNKRKVIYRLCISIAASLGAAGFVISVLSIIRMINSEHAANSMWDVYMDGYYYYQDIKLYLFTGAFIVFILFYVLEIHRKKISN